MLEYIINPFVTGLLYRFITILILIIFLKHFKLNYKLALQRYPVLAAAYLCLMVFGFYDAFEMGFFAVFGFFAMEFTDERLVKLVNKFYNYNVDAIKNKFNKNKINEANAKHLNEAIKKDLKKLKT